MNRESFDDTLRSHSEEFFPLLRGRDPGRVWRSLGEPGYDELAVALTAYHLSDLEDQVAAIDKARIYLNVGN